MFSPTKNTFDILYKRSCDLNVIDCHTHIQDDIADISSIKDLSALTGTQASFNSIPIDVIAKAKNDNYMVRRLMMDATHGLSYSWFMQIAEGGTGCIDDVIKRIGKGDCEARRDAGRMLVNGLQDSRYTEYADWLRIMFSFYMDNPELDTLDIKNYDLVFDAITAKRNNKNLSADILKKYNITGYVTSIENRDNIPFGKSHPQIEDVDLAHSTHNETFNMFDAMYFIWPEGATDFGLFTSGHKYEFETYIINLEKMLGVPINSGKELKEAIKNFFFSLMWSPKSNPNSRVRFTDIFLPINFLLKKNYDITIVNSAINHHKSCLHYNELKELTALASESMLEALDEIGLEIKLAGYEYGSCLQIAHGVTYFMDKQRELQSFIVYNNSLPQQNYPMWNYYKNIHFEYILAHEQLYKDFANVAKQVNNISVGPWWHLCRKDSMAKMFYEQLMMGPVSSIASGFTDARFVEMLVAKYQSVRWAISYALSAMVDDPFSSLHKKHDKATEIMKEILYTNPKKKHSLMD